MRTKQELIDFLNRVVGEPYVFIDGDDEDGSVDIKPYNFELSNGHTFTHFNADTVSGHITFKGERLDSFNNSGLDMVKTLVECMNHAYSTSIKDCLANDPDMLSHYKMSRFKFS